eukprot:7114156-Lingulodinium_polyedra.AAC.1
MEAPLLPPKRPRESTPPPSSVGGLPGPAPDAAWAGDPAGRRRRRVGKDPADPGAAEGGLDV